MTDKVISIKDYKKKEKTEDKEELDFEEIMKRNAENKERMRKEREKDNRSVKRSYRLRSKKDD